MPLLTRAAMGSIGPNPSNLEAVAEAAAAVTEPPASESSALCTLRLHRLLHEGRHAEALRLAKHSKLIFYQLKALVQIGTFDELAGLMKRDRISSKSIESLVSPHITTLRPQITTTRSVWRVRYSSHRPLM